MIDSLKELLQNGLNLSLEAQVRILYTLAVLVVAWLLRLIAVREIDRHFVHDVRGRYSWRKIADYITTILSLVIIGRIWISGVQMLATYLGLVSAGVAIALQDLIVNLAGWFFIIWRRPFVVGDRIQVGDLAGDVIDIRVFEFSLLEIGNWVDSDQSTGRIVHVPNGKVFREVFANYNQGLPFIWHEIPVLVTFESDWQKAKQLLFQIVTEKAPPVTESLKERIRQSSGRFVIAYANLTPTVYTKASASGVLLTMRYMVDPRKRRDAEQRVWEAVLQAFNEDPDLELAYPTERRYQHWVESKMRPEAEQPEN